MMGWRASGPESACVAPWWASGGVLVVEGRIELDAEDGPGPGWHIVLVPGGREKLAIRFLEEWGFTAEIPMLTLFRRHRRGSQRPRVSYRKAVVAGYLFVRADQPLWRALMHPFVRGCVMIDGRAARVPDRAFRAFRRAVSDERRPKVWRASLEKGDRATIGNGPLRGQRVEICEVTEEYARVMFDLLGARRPVEVRISDLDPE